MYLRLRWLMVFLACVVVTAVEAENTYTIIDVGQRVTCTQKQEVNGTELPIYEISGLTEFSGKDVSAELKVCDNPTNKTYCSDVSTSGWYMLSECTFDTRLLNAQCTVPAEIAGLYRGYFRLFVYTDVTLAAVSNKFLHPLKDGCFCSDENIYLPGVNDVNVIHNEQLEHGVYIRVQRPSHVTSIHATNFYKYEFHLHRTADRVERVLPLKNIDPLEFRIEKLKACNVYAFQVSILQKFLSCRFKSGKYYHIQKFTYDPNNNCDEKKKTKSSFNVTLVFAVAFPVIIVGLVVAFVLIKCECATQRRGRTHGSLNFESMPNSSSRMPADAIVKSDHGYDAVHIYDTIPAVTKRQVVADEKHGQVTNRIA